MVNDKWYTRSRTPLAVRHEAIMRVVDARKSDFSSSMFRRTSRCILLLPEAKKGAINLRNQECRHPMVASSTFTGEFLTSAGSGAMLLRLMEDGRAVTYARSLNGGGQALAIET